MLLQKFRHFHDPQQDDGMEKSVPDRLLYIQSGKKNEPVSSWDLPLLYMASLISPLGSRPVGAPPDTLNLLISNHILPLLCFTYNSA